MLLPIQKYFSGGFETFTFIVILYIYFFSCGIDDVAGTFCKLFCHFIYLHNTQRHLKQFIHFMLLPIYLFTPFYGKPMFTVESNVLITLIDI